MLVPSCQSVSSSSLQFVTRPLEMLTNFDDDCVAVCWYSRVLIIAVWYLLQSVAGRTFSVLNSLLQ